MRNDYLSYLKERTRFQGLSYPKNRFNNILFNTGKDYFTYLREKQKFHGLNDSKTQKHRLLNDLFTRSKNDMGTKACSFYLLIPKGGRIEITKLGISKNPDKRMKQHVSQTNIPFKIYKKFWFKNEAQAKRIEKSVVNHLHQKGHQRSGKEFFHQKPEIILHTFQKFFLELKEKGLIF